MICFLPTCSIYYILYTFFPRLFNIRPSKKVIIIIIILYSALFYMILRNLLNIRPSKKVINPSENLGRLLQLTIENTFGEAKVIFFLQ